MNKDQAFEKDWNEYMNDQLCSDDCKHAFKAAWNLQQAKIDNLAEAASNVTILTNTDFNKLWAKKLEEALSSVEE